MSSNKTAQGKQPASAPAKRRWPLFAGAVFLSAIVLAAAGFLAGTTLEENDSFCTSCHTVPETTYVKRSADARAVGAVTDMASAHFHDTQAKGQSFACIQCHRGNSTLPDRVQTLALAARDTLTLWSGQADPTIEKPAIKQPLLANTACAGCHETTLLTVKGRQNHFHNFLPATAALLAQGKAFIQSGGEREHEYKRVDTAITCTDCHNAHQTIATPDPQIKRMDRTTVQKACDTCHKAANERRQTIDRLFRGGGDD
jgi:hypothetical protein